MIADAQLLDDGAALAGIPIENAVKLSDVEAVSELLRLVEVVNVDESVVDELVVDARVVERRGEPIVAIEIELKAKRAPGGYAQIAETVLGVDKVEVVVRALARVVAEVRLVRRLVMPRPVGLTGLHRRQDAHEPRFVAALVEDLPYDVFFANVALAQKLDLDAVALGELLGILANLVAQRFGKLGVVEDSDAARSEVRGHPLAVAKSRQRAVHDDAIPAGNYA